MWGENGLPPKREKFVAAKPFRSGIEVAQQRTVGCMAVFLRMVPRANAERGAAKILASRCGKVSYHI